VALNRTAGKFPGYSRGAFVSQVAAASFFCYTAFIYGHAFIFAPPPLRSPGEGSPWVPPVTPWEPRGGVGSPGEALPRGGLPLGAPGRVWEGSPWEPRGGLPLGAPGRPPWEGLGSPLGGSRGCPFGRAPLGPPLRPRGGWEGRGCPREVP